MAVDRFVLLEPAQPIPLEAHHARDGPVAVEHPGRRLVRLAGAHQRVQPRGPELHLLRVVLVAQELRYAHR